MVRVSLKNTFLSFDEHEGDENEDDCPIVASKQAASPRSRSLECPSPSRGHEEHQQIEKLNRLLETDSTLASPALGPSSSPRRPDSPRRMSSPGASPGSQPVGGGVLDGFPMLPGAAPAATPPQRSSCSSGAASSSQAPTSGKQPLPIGSEGPSAQELLDLRQRSSSSGAASSSQAPPGGKQNLPFGSEGPSAQELRQLQRRLEEACQSRGRRNSEECAGAASSGVERSQVTYVAASPCSVSSMANESSDGEEANAGHALVGLRRNPPMIHPVRSTTSVCSLASEAIEDRGETNYGETVEFDLTIEEEPQVQRWSSEQSEPQAAQDAQLDAPWVRPRRQRASDPGPDPLPRRGRCGSDPVFDGGRGRGSPGGSGRASPGGSGRGSPGGSGLASPGGGRASPGGSASPNGSRPSGSPRGRLYSAPNSPKPGSPRDSRFSQWRPLPKEYRHGHVPKNLNLADQYRNSDQAAPPTTLMIRNIPNRYTQRELITELEDLGFAGTFDFLYIPLDKGTMSNVGYAFVNFVEPEWAEKCMAAFQNYRFKLHRKISGKIAAISVAHIQGLEANLAHYENAAVNTAKLKQRRPVVMANISQSLTEALSDD